MEDAECRTAVQEMVSDGEQKRRRDDALVEREALAAISLFVKNAGKKEVVSFWYIFLPDRCFCPVQRGVSELMHHQSKKMRMLVTTILVDFLTHSKQFLALAQHQVCRNFGFLSSIFFYFGMQSFC